MFATFLQVYSNKECAFYRSGSADQQANMTSVEESISQTEKLNLDSSTDVETDAKPSSSEEALKTEIPMPTGPKTR